MAHAVFQPLAADVHALALADAKRDGRERTARRYGVGVATLERALAFASLAPLTRRAIESGARERLQGRAGTAAPEARPTTPENAAA